MPTSLLFLVKNQYEFYNFIIYRTGFEVLILIILSLPVVEWSGEVRGITYSADGKSVSVVYRVTLYGTDAEVYIGVAFIAFISEINTPIWVWFIFFG